MRVQGFPGGKGERRKGKRENGGKGKKGKGEKGKRGKGGRRCMCGGGEGERGERERGGGEKGEREKGEGGRGRGRGGEGLEADDALAEALHLDAVAVVAWQRFSGKGKGKSKSKGKAKGKGKSKGSNLSLEDCRTQEPYELSSVRFARTFGRRRHLSQERQERRFAAATGTRVSGFRRRNTRFCTLLNDDTSADATALVAHARLDASDIPVETPPKAPPVRDDHENHRVSFIQRLHRHLSALEDAKSTAVEARKPRLNVSLVSTAGS